jgi:hypothetical protein
MTSHRRRPTKAEKAQALALVAVLEPDPPRLPLWAVMQHKVGTCDPATCLLCRGSEPDGAG